MKATVLFALTLSAFASPEEGAAIFEKQCATCHKDPPVNRAPLPDALKKLPSDQILMSITRGSMREMAASLSADQKNSVVQFLVKDAAKIVSTNAGKCSEGYQPRADSTYWNGWGVDETNSRFQPAKMAGLSAPDIPGLKLKWAFGISSATSAMGQPTMFAGRLFFGSQDGTVYAIDAQTGCVFWTFKAPATVRTAITIATLGHAKQAAMFGDLQANAYAVDVKDGKLIWQLKLDDHPVARITGAPKVSGSRVYVPVSSVEEVTGGNAKYECCTFRGSVVAIDIETGKRAWKTHSIPDPPTPHEKE